MTETVLPQDAAKWLAAGDAVLIDVREADEFRAGHIAYAVSLPLGDLGDLIGHMKLPAERKLIFQCERGKRGAQACALVKTCNACAGEVYNLEGGMAAWKDAGLPVVGASSRLPVIRQVQMIVGGAIVLGTALGFAGLNAGFALAGLLGAALFMAGLTGWCGLAMILAKMPWNK